MSPILFILIFQSFCSFQILGSDHSDYSEASKSYLKVALDLIDRVKLYFPEGPTRYQENKGLPMDCGDVLLSGHNESGVYTVWPRSRLTDGKHLKVYCDMDTDDGGWTVIQRRGNFNKPANYFYRDWATYKVGFGDIEEDFWLGNDNIFALTNQRENSIRFDLQKKREKRHALYDDFWIDDEIHKYMLHIDGYSGNAGEAMIGGFDYVEFSTKDNDNDKDIFNPCRKVYKGGWWYSVCYDSNLNGLNEETRPFIGDGNHWYGFTLKNEFLDASEMKIRPKYFKRKLNAKYCP